VPHPQNSLKTEEVQISELDVGLAIPNACRARLLYDDGGPFWVAALVCFLPVSEMTPQFFLSLTTQLLNPVLPILALCPPGPVSVVWSKSPAELQVSPPSVIGILACFVVSPVASTLRATVLPN